MKQMSLLLISGVLLASAPVFAKECPQGKLPSISEIEGANRGVSEKTELIPFDGGDELLGLEEHQIRVRTFTLEPGGHMQLFENEGPHANSHLHVKAGQIAEYSDDDKTFTCFEAGQILRKPTDHTHWIANIGETPAVVISTDIISE